MKIMLTIGVPLLAAVIWALLMAPKSTMQLKGIAYLALKLLLFGLAVAALIATGKVVLGVLLGIVVLINTVLLYVLKP